MLSGAKPYPHREAESARSNFERLKLFQYSAKRWGMYYVSLSKNYLEITWCQGLMHPKVDIAMATAF